MGRKDSAAFIALIMFLIIAASPIWLVLALGLFFPFVFVGAIFTALFSKVASLLRR
jgi:hypothetical protein